MTIATKDQLLSLDIGSSGSPFCVIGTKSTIEFLGLDWGEKGGPFVGVLPSGLENNLSIISTLAGASVNAQLQFISPIGAKNAEIEVTLSGVTANVQLLQTEFIRDLVVLFSLRGYGVEDVSSLFEIIRNYMVDMGVEFHVDRPNVYQFENVSVLFEIAMGETFTDVSVLFSVIRTPVNFVSYIFQKLYCTCTEILDTLGRQYVDIYDWNVKPNKTWYVCVNNGVVTLYNTQADMVAGINAFATGTADADLKVVLDTIDEYDSISFYYLDYPTHLSISGVEAVPQYFKILPLTDIAEIRHPMYNNSNVALSRGQAELDLHTYSEVKKELVLGVHLPTIEPGDTMEYESVRRDSTVISQILSNTISGSTSGGQSILINTIRTSTYTELVRS